MLAIGTLITFAFFSCESNTSKFKNYEPLIVINDTIPNKITEIPGQYIISFDERRTDSIENTFTFLEKISFLQRSAFLSKMFQPLKLQDSSIISLTPYDFVAKLDTNQLSIIKARPGVKFLEKDYLIEVHPNIAVEVALSTEEICWGITRVSNNVKGNRQYDKLVWIIDSGVDPFHEDLNVEKKLSKSFYPETNYGDVQGEGNDHGTQVAGVIGAIANGRGVIGMAPNVRIVAVKFMHNRKFRLSNYLDALSYVNANARKGDIVNLSIQNTPESSRADYLIHEMSRKGIFVVISAGNLNQNVDNGGIYPAKMNGNNIYTVSSFDEGDLFSDFSNYGPSVDVSAPGRMILTTLPGNKYGLNEGTSFAAPFVSGLLLLNGTFKMDKQIKNDPDSRKDSVGHE